MKVRFPDHKKDPGIFLCSRLAVREKQEILNCSILDSQRTITKTINQIQVLRLWNSSTPLFSRLRRSCGGCYYLIWNHKGIIIDPGFDFARIFNAQFRTLEDIDVVVVTHDHPDHCEGVSDILTLLHEFNEKRTSPHVIRFAVSRGTYSKFASLFRKKPLKNYVRKLKPNMKLKLMPKVSVSTTKNRHREIHSRSHGIGLKFNLRNASSPYSFGITSDTGYHLSLSKFYDGVDMLIAHIGTLEDFRTRALLEDHLGFRGIVLLLKGMTHPPNLVLISEWGEELHGLRKIIGEYLGKYSTSSHILPTDLSFTLSIPNNEVYIEQDNRFAPAKNAIVSNDYGDRLRYAVI